jgi:hypothetical protein
MVWFDAKAALEKLAGSWRTDSTSAWPGIIQTPRSPFITARPVPRITS